MYRWGEREEGVSDYNALSGPCADRRDAYVQTNSAIAIVIAIAINKNVCFVQYLHCHLACALSRIYIAAWPG